MKSGMGDSANGSTRQSRIRSTKRPAAKLKAVRKPGGSHRSPQMLKVRLSDGRLIEIRKYPPRLDPEFAALVRAHAKSLQTGFARAVREAKRRNVPLSTILPVS